MELRELGVNNIEDVIKLPKKGGGGEADIFEIQINNTSKALKIYKEENLGKNGPPLSAYIESLISIKSRFSQEDKNVINQYTTWPEEKIFYENNFIGYIMKLVPQTYFTLKNPAKPQRGYTAINLSLVLGATHNLRDKITDVGMITIVLRLLQICEVLHRHNVIIGDFNAKNLFFHIDAVNQGRNHVIFTDIDSFRMSGTRHPLNQANAEDWKTPEYIQYEEEFKQPDTPAKQKEKLENLMSFQLPTGDVYKVCLAIVRLYYKGIYVPKLNNTQMLSIIKTIADKSSSDFAKLIYEGLSNDPLSRPQFKDLYNSLIKVISKINKG